MARIGALPLAHAPGARWHYGLSTDVLGVLIQRASGTSLPDYLRTRIFEPLGSEFPRSSTISLMVQAACLAES